MNTLSQNRYRIFASGHVIGVVKNGVFTKRINGSRHILRTPPAISLDVAVLRQINEYDAHTIQITDRETGTVYSCDYGYFIQHSFELNRGYEDQRALALDQWNVTSGISFNAYDSVTAQTPTPEYVETVTGESKAVQLELFGRLA